MLIKTPQVILNIKLTVTLYYYYTITPQIINKKSKAEHTDETNLLGAYMYTRDIIRFMYKI